ncbi:hypothetical protein CYMTET_32103 [Cymbomonas tetramitiformis]|uniref:Uncharacterized protein n=1 Tax=Cymbomonas tetramitiformis TaxID=36881 RepID=A0AAE0KSK0_9CHLO|nr:hypothetical protein CYMTET_32103 [Cymbomonas tetramitiformis]
MRRVLFVLLGLLGDAASSERDFRVTGYNYKGQLGDGSYENKYLPELAWNESDVILASAGGYHTLFLTAGFGLYATGGNSFGQLGIGSLNTLNTSSPQLISNHLFVGALAAGAYNSFIITTGGKAYAWGRNDFGQLGDGTTIDRLSMVLVAENVAEVAPGDYFTLFRMSGNLEVYGVGRNYYGQLGDGSKSDHTSLTRVLTEGHSIVQVVAGSAHALLLTSAHRVLAFGRNDYGQLGDGTNDDVATPKQVMVEHNVTEVCAGAKHSLFRTGVLEGDLWLPQATYAVGADNFGQLGLDRTGQVEGPRGNMYPSHTVPVASMTDQVVVGLRAGQFHSAFLTEGNKVFMSGANTEGLHSVTTTTTAKTTTTTSTSISTTT